MHQRSRLRSGLISWVRQGKGKRTEMRGIRIKRSVVIIFQSGAFLLPASEVWPAPHWWPVRQSCCLTEWEAWKEYHGTMQPAMDSSMQTSNINCYQSQLLGCSVSIPITLAVLDFDLIWWELFWEKENMPCTLKHQFKEAKQRNQFKTGNCKLNYWNSETVLW